MRLPRPLIALLVAGGVLFVGSLDFNTASLWWKNQVAVTSQWGVADIAAGEPWHVKLAVTTFDPFGNRRQVELPSDQFQLTMEPLDDSTAELAQLIDGHVTCNEPAILHLRFRVELAPHCRYRFNLDGGTTVATITGVLRVDRNTDHDWHAVQLEEEPEHLQRHLSVVAQGRSTQSQTAWPPQSVVSNRDVTLMSNASIIGYRGPRSIDGRYVINDGETDRDLPTPPSRRGWPLMCLFQNQWILAGGELPDGTQINEQVVVAYDLSSGRWRQLPSLPPDVAYVEAVMGSADKLVALATTRDPNTGQWQASTFFVLGDEGWEKESEIDWNISSDYVLPLSFGLLFVSNQSQSEAVPIKLLKNGRLETLSLPLPIAGPVLITTIDDRIFQWTEDRVYELEPSLL